MLEVRFRFATERNFPTELCCTGLSLQPASLCVGMHTGVEQPLKERRGKGGASGTKQGLEQSLKSLSNTVVKRFCNLTLPGICSGLAIARVLYSIPAS